MRILLTNDDGFASEGLSALYNALSAKHEIWRVAPQTEQSGKSHSISVSEAILIHQEDPHNYQITGSPADCVRAALLHIMPYPPDCIISGINKGENIGSDIIYSGTAAAARQGAIMEIPSIACSIYDNGKFYRFKEFASIIAKHIKNLHSLWTQNHFININAPNEDLSNARLVCAHPCKRPYSETPYFLDLPNTYTSLYLHGIAQYTGEDPGSDWDELKKGNIAVSPIYLYPTLDSDREKYQENFPQQV